MKTVYYFEPKYAFLFFISFAIVCFSVFSFEILKKRKLSLILLVLGTFGTFLFSALIDPFINIWDEQYHALVAKNLIEHLLKPTLFEHEIMDFSFANWTANHIWLHKQPLFLWQIALSIKLFGANVFAVRLPSVIMLSLLPLFVYRIGKLTLNSRTGFYGALLIATSYFAHELATGFPPSDHNDIAFLFYITLSIWAWVEHENAPKNYWIILIGFLSGCSILVKWLTGLLVFSGWGLSILLIKERRNSFNSYKEFTISFIICLLTFVPWQIYILLTFPQESSFEYSNNTRHFFEVIENHGGDAFYYYENISKIYGAGTLVPLLILISLFIFYKSLRNNIFRIALLSEVIIVYLFFTIAATKMVAFCFIISPIIFLALASLIEKLILYFESRVVERIILKALITSSFLSLIAWGNINLRKIAYKHTMLIRPNDNDGRLVKINDDRFIHFLANKITKDYIVLNCKQLQNITLMFYTGCIAYDKLPSIDEFNELKKNKYNLAAIDNGKLPIYISEDPSVLKIKAWDTTW